MDTPRPIIIIKKKVSHGGHHGGAWKVAYADFVTAMMALFIVLWLLNTSKPVKEAIAGYFKDPSGTGTKTGTTNAATGEPILVTKDNMSALKEALEKSIKQMPDFDKLKNQVEMTITPEGLRIELLETATGTFFDSGSSSPNKHGKELLAMLAKQLGELPNRLSIEGHTDSKPYAGKHNYSNWELSADRANAARRLMQESGVGANQVSQVRGYADQRPRIPDKPFDPSNRRISVIVQYLEKKPKEEDSAAEKPGEHSEGNSEATPEGNSEATPEGKSEAKPEGKSDEKPEGKPEAKPETPPPAKHE